MIQILRWRIVHVLLLIHTAKESVDTSAIMGIAECTVISRSGDEIYGKVAGFEAASFEGPDVPAAKLTASALQHICLQGIWALPE